MENWLSSDQWDGVPVSMDTVIGRNTAPQMNLPPFRFEERANATDTELGKNT